MSTTLLNVLENSAIQQEQKASRRRGAAQRLSALQRQILSWYGRQRNGFIQRRGYQTSARRDPFCNERAGMHSVEWKRNSFYRSRKLLIDRGYLEIVRGFEWKISTPEWLNLERPGAIGLRLTDRGWAAIQMTGATPQLSFSVAMSESEVPT